MKLGGWLALLLILAGALMIGGGSQLAFHALASPTSVETYGDNGRAQVRSETVNLDLLGQRQAVLTIAGALFVSGWIAVAGGGLMAVGGTNARLINRRLAQLQP